MNQIVKDKMEREIMVIKNDILFKDIPRKNWFYENTLDTNFEDIIKNNFEYMKRAIAEENFNYKQPIPYAVVVDENNYIFVYKRWGTNSNAGESRLHNKVSIWVWWHIEKEEENSSDPIYDTLLREIQEELNIKKENIKDIITVGYINDDTNNVWKVHFGIAYIVKIDNSNIDLLDGEIENWEFESIEKVQHMIDSPEYDMEAWSKIIFPQVKKILAN